MMTQEKALKVQKKKPVNKNRLKVKRTQRTKELFCIWSILIIPLINLCIFWVYGTIQSVPLAFEQRLRDGTTKFNLHKEAAYHTETEDNVVVLLTLPISNQQMFLPNPQLESVSLHLHLYSLKCKFYEHLRMSWEWNAG